MSDDTLLATPQDWFDKFNQEFDLQVDYAASDESHLLDEYITEKQNSLERDWDADGWCSPPWHDGIEQWVSKGIRENILHGSTIVMLLPVREDAPWWEQSKFADEIRPVELDFIPMSGDKDREFTVEPHCLWIFKGAIMDYEKTLKALPEPLRSQILNGDWSSDKNESDVLEARIQDISDSFTEQYPRFNWSWIVETHADEEQPYLIMNLMIDDVTEGYYFVPYTYADDRYLFADPILWREVESTIEWTEIVKAAKDPDAAVKFDIDACPKKMIKVLEVVKAAGEEESLVIGAYATIWGELDCDGERMQKEALAPYVDSNATPYMFWLHGWDNSFGSTIVGEWNKDAFMIDDVGLYVEGTLTHPEAVRRLKESGEFGLSVGSNPQYVQTDGLGNILDWALLEISVMEGGKQCVPNARAEVDKVDNQYEELLASKAAEFGAKDEERGNRETRAREGAASEVKQGV